MEIVCVNLRLTQACKLMVKKGWVDYFYREVQIVYLCILSLFPVLLSSTWRWEWVNLDLSWDPEGKEQYCNS